MEYSTEELPPHVLDGCDKGNFQTRNARFRAAVCQHLKLQWVSVGGTGNCFFESICLQLPSAGDRVNARDLRRNLIQLFRECSDTTQPVLERIYMEIAGELGQQLVCSTHASINGRRINGLAPATVAEYLDACSADGVWTQGFHWLRAVSYLHDVRIGVVIYGHPIVRFFGDGPRTIWLYKVDAGKCSCSPFLPQCVHSHCLHTMQRHTGTRWSPSKLQSKTMFLLFILPLALPVRAPLPLPVLCSVHSVSHCAYRRGRRSARQESNSKDGVRYARHQERECWWQWQQQRYTR